MQTGGPHVKLASLTALSMNPETRAQVYRMLRIAHLITSVGPLATWKRCESPSATSCPARGASALPAAVSAARALLARLLLPRTSRADARVPARFAHMPG